MEEKYVQGKKKIKLGKKKIELGKKNKKNKQAQRRAAGGPIPSQKSRVNSVPGAIFSHLMFEINFYHVHRFSWEKYTKMIGHML